MAVFALVIAVFNLFCSVWLYVELQKKLSPTDIEKKLSSYSDELKQTYGRSVKEIEAEWCDMYEKFSKLAGRMDKRRGIEQAQAAQEPRPEVQNLPSRSDLVRKHRGGAQQ
jgi:hypothetical protein